MSSTKSSTDYIIDELITFRRIVLESDGLTDTREPKEPTFVKTLQLLNDKLGESGSVSTPTVTGAATEPTFVKTLQLLNDKLGDPGTNSV